MPTKKLTDLQSTSKLFWFMIVSEIFLYHFILSFSWLTICNLRNIFKKLYANTSTRNICFLVGCYYNICSSVCNWVPYIDIYCLLDPVFILHWNWTYYSWGNLKFFYCPVHYSSVLFPNNNNDNSNKFFSMNSGNVIYPENYMIFRKPLLPIFCNTGIVFPCCFGTIPKYTDICYSIHYWFLFISNAFT